MTLAAGTRLGGYEVLSLVGVGGMGEVYRARDTKLERAVAIKILPEAFSADPDRVARFEREARTLAALNHPHIAHVYGLETAAQPPALVMELVEGPTLADRIASGPIALEDALPIARQICDALEAAHEVGIVHRDLKPANVKLRPDGTVKVLDFGLAKALTREPAGTSAYDFSHSPTITNAGATQFGVLLGTAAYMSPEQARGKPVDKRADIWAFGAVLYEMLTGTRAFEGEDVSLTLAAIMKSEPDWTALPAETPLAVKTLLIRCLQKDPKSRLRDIGDARLALDGAFEAPSPPALSVVPPVTMSRARRMLPWVAGLLLSVATGFAVWVVRPEPFAPVVRFEIAVPNLSRGNGPNFTLSADGRSLIYAEAGAPGPGRLMRRDMSTLRAEPIAGTEGAETFPFFSPDGAWIGFVAGRSRVIRKVPAAGGTASTVAATAAPIYNAAWLSDGTIVFGSPTGLWRVDASGGNPEQVAKTNRDTGGVQSLPDGRGVLFHVNPLAGENDGTIEVLLPSGTRQVVAQGMNPYYVPTGHLLFARPGGSLWAAPFDLETLTMTREPVPLPESAYRRGPVNPSELALAANGSLVYMPTNSLAARSLVWVDRNGRASEVVSESGGYAYPRLSPEGRRVALMDGSDVWVTDVVRSTRTRLSYGDRGNASPAVAWTPDGRRVTFFVQSNTAPSQRTGTRVVARRADASAPPDLLLLSDRVVTSGSWSPNGKAYVYAERPSADVNTDLKVIQPGAAQAPVEFLASRFSEWAPSFSPNGRWLAYISNESGRDEIYVSPFPGPGDRQTVSSGGGTDPVWSRDGRELFYRNGDAMMAVAVSEGSTLSLGQPKRLFQGTYQTGALAAAYDVSPDGRRFLMVQPLATSTISLITILNWFEELQQLVPTR